MTNAMKEAVAGELRYADPRLRQRSSLLALAIVCGATQLMIAVGLFVWWALSGARLAISFAILDSIGGVVLFLAGCTCLLVHDHLSEKRGVDAAQRRRSLTTWILLFSNILVAISCITGASMLKDAHTLVVQNHRSVSFDACSVITPDRTISLGPLRSGESVRCRFRVHGAGEIRLLTVHGGTRSDMQVSYVGPGDGPVTQEINLTNGVFGISSRRSPGLR